MPVQQVGALLKRWQEATGVLSQGRVIADGMRLISGLTPEERRTLARALSEEGAPAIAERLDSASGGRIDAGSAHDAARGLLSLDREQIAHLAEVLSDPDERQRLAHRAASHGLDALGESIEPGSAGATPPPPPPGSRLPSGLAPPAPEPDRAGSYRTDSLHAVANGEVHPDDIELGDQLLDHPGLAEIHLGETDLHEITISPTPDPADAGLGWDDSHDAGGGGPSGADVGAGGVAGGIASGAAASRLRRGDDPDGDPHDDDVHVPGGARAGDDGGRPGDEQPADTATHEVDAARDPWVGHLDDADAHHAPPPSPLAAPTLDRPATVEQVAALLRSLRDARTAHQRFAALAGHHLAGFGVDAALRVLDAVPEGWQRRRAAARLIQAGALRGVTPTDLFRRFPRRADATFVAGAALGDGVLGLDDLSPALPADVVRRLSARSDA